MEHWKLHVLGSRGSFPVCGADFLEFGGGTSCYILKRGDYAIIIDCGTGLNDATQLLADCGRIDILLTHLHYDHLLGLLNWGVFPQGARKRFFAQFGAWFGEESLRRFISPPFWPITPDFGELVSVDSPGLAELDEGVRVRFQPAPHPDSASILRIETEDGAVCASFDYEHGKPFPDFMAEDCAALIYDAAYDDSDYEAHRGWGHSTWREGCALAERLRVRLLLLAHHDALRTDAELCERERQARVVFPAAHFARAGDVFDLRERRG